MLKGLQKPFIVLTMLLCFIHSEAQLSAHFSKLKSLEGTWSMQTRKGPLYESWFKLNDSIFIGKSYRLINTDTLLLETMELFRKGENIFFVPTVQNQEAVSFRLLSVEGDNFVFDNPGHDFPQRVVYQLPKNGSLHAWIEGMDKGSYRKSEFRYRRVP